MANTEFNSEYVQPPYPNLPPVIESLESEYTNSGITSSVAIAGHPIHPVIVVFPVAFLTAAAGTDIGYWLTKDYFWARASTWLIGLGLVAGILAALVGMSDFLKIPRVRKRTAGWAHMTLNVVALVLTAVNFGMRFNDPTGFIIPLGTVTSLVVATLLGAGGWYGGELSFRHKVGVIGSNET